jgi:hypothetical protein
MAATPEGLVGTSCSNGNYGGDGGTVTVTNTATGSIYTTQNHFHGIFAQSIGGSGGSRFFVLGRM